MAGGSRSLVIPAQIALNSNVVSAAFTSYSSYTGTSEGTIRSKGEEKFIERLKGLLRYGKGSDVELIVGGRSIRAHKLLLGMQSPVFAEMFEKDASGQPTSVVRIDDCDPDTFPDFLHYLYTGTIEHLTPNKAPRLYITATKFQQEELEDECLEHMKVNITLENFWDVLSISIKYRNRELLKLTNDFFLDRAADIVSTEKWHKFMFENPVLANQLVFQLAKDKSPSVQVSTVQATKYSTSGRY